MCVCVRVCVCVRACTRMHTCVLGQVQCIATLWTVACQASLSLRFSQEEYWSGLPFPPPGGLPDPGIESVSPLLAGGFFTTEPSEKPYNNSTWVLFFKFKQYQKLLTENRKITKNELWHLTRLYLVILDNMLVYSLHFLDIVQIFKMISM